MSRLLGVLRRFMLMKNQAGGFKVRLAVAFVNGRTIDFVPLLYYKSRVRFFLFMNKDKEAHNGIQG
jgi:hypothetical protein